MTYRNVEVEFPERGLVLVTGSNIASGGSMSSIGAGKTGLGELLSRTLLNVPGRFTRIGDYSTHGKGNLYIRVEGVLNGQPLVVENGYKCKELNPAGEAVRFTLNGKTVERSHLAHTKDELERILNVGPNLAQWTVFIDGDRLRFGSLSEKAGVDLLITALSRQSWEDSYTAAKAKMEAFNLSVVEIKGSHETLVRQEAQCRMLVQNAQTGLIAATQHYQQAVEANKKACQEAEKQLAEYEANVQRSSRRIKELSAKIETIAREQAARFTELVNTCDGLDTQINSAHQQHLAANNQASELRARWSAIQEEVETLQSVPEFCPTCNKPWDTKVSRDVVQEKMAIRDGIKAEYDQAQSLVQQWANHLRTLKEQKRRAVLARDALKTEDTSRQYADELDQHQEFIDNGAAYQHTLVERVAQLKVGVSNEAVTSAQAILTDRQQQLVDVQQQIAEKSTSLAESEMALKVFQYWTVAYSPVGIPNMLLEESIAPLNEVSRRISTLLSGGLINIGYATRKTLKSGKDKASLQIKVDNAIGCKSLDGSSKGEAGLSNLIVAETLSEIGSISHRVGFRWYDEILNSQDDVVRRSILAYLKDLAQRLGILVFIVDHHLETASYVDHVLVAEKGADGFTTFHWR